MSGSLGSWATSAFITTAVTSVVLFAQRENPAVF
jgi:hypothetical protein